MDGLQRASHGAVSPKQLKPRSAMRFVHATLLLVVITACSKSEGATETAVKASVDQPSIAAVAGPVPLDTLIAQLDTIHGFYWPKTTRVYELTNAELHPERFREHGKVAVQRLIDCLTDTATTATYHHNDMDFKYPRGMLCYEVLRDITDVDHSRHLPLNRQDIYVSLNQGDLRAELRRAQRAWQIIHNARAYRLRTITPDAT
jgi:hypothetical protein